MSVTDRRTPAARPRAARHPTPGRDDALAEVEALLTDKVTVLLGHSGVGKSTLVNRLVPAADLDTEALAMARRIAAGSRQSQGRTKALMRNAFETPLAEQLDAEKAAFMACAAHPDFAEGVGAFLERRNPVFED